jgi:hypothetical protein
MLQTLFLTQLFYYKGNAIISINSELIFVEKKNLKLVEIITTVL